MSQEQDRTRRSEGGFSLIEMLVIVLIIAVLAAIAIPFFLSQRTRSFESQAQATLRDASTAMKSYAVQNDGTYPGIGDEAFLVGQGFRATDGAPVLIRSGGSSFCLEVNHDSLSDDWHYEAAAGKPVSGSCPP